MDICLKDITKDNWLDMIELKITKEQENYVALNSESIACSKFYDDYVNKGIYLDNTAIGFMQYFPNHYEGKPNEIYIDQLMIDVNHQGQGYGKKAIQLVLSEIKKMPQYQTISICYVQGHTVMKKFFENFGFEVIQQDEFDETIMVLKVN